MRRTISRRRFLKGVGLSAAGGLLAACGAAPAATPEATAPAAAAEPTVAPPVAAAAEPTSAPTTAPATVEATATEAAEATAAGGSRTGDWVVNYPPFDKYSPTKNFTSPRSAGSNINYIGGDTVEEHAGDRLTEERLGIRYTSKFISASGGEYREKLNLGMAAGDLPDFFTVYPFDLYAQMVEAGVLKDLTDLWPQAASAHMQEVLSWSDGLLWEPITIDGRFYGFPGIKVVGQDEKLLWYRQDWLDKIDAKPPTTLDELRDVALALVEAKVAGPDRPTIGLPLNNELNTWICSTDPVFGAYGVMPGYWKRMEDGSVMNYSIMPETREALALLSAWYKDGIIDPEFFTLDTGKSVEPIINGQAGLYFGPYWCPRWPNSDAAKNDPNAVWGYTTIPTGPAGRGTKFTLPVQSAYCIGAQVSDEDAVAILKGVAWVDALTHPDFQAQTNWHGFEGYDYQWEGDTVVLTPETEAQTIPAGARIDVLVQLREYEYNEVLSKRPASELDAYEQALVKATFAEGEAQRYRDTYEAYKIALDAVEKYAIRSAFNGIPTPTIVSELGNLTELEASTFIDIIVGNKPIEAFDEFVGEWKSRGGDAMTEEVGAYLAAS